MYPGGVCVVSGNRRPGAALLGLIEPVHIAHMVVYLASEESARTTGQILPVDSGVTIR